MIVLFIKPLYCVFSALRMAITLGIGLKNLALVEEIVIAAIL
jgi:hypothetical protein